MILQNNIDRLIVDCGLTDFKQITNIRQLFDEYDMDFDDEIKGIYDGARNRLSVSFHKGNPDLHFICEVTGKQGEKMDSFILFRLNKSFERLERRYAPLFHDVFNPLK